MHRIAKKNRIAPLPLAIGAVLLLIISSGVMLMWHLPHLIPAIYPYATLMAYNTAMCFLFCAAALFALLKSYRHLGITPHLAFFY